MIEVWFYNIPIYFNPDTGEVKGKNKLYSFLLVIMLWIHMNIIVSITGLYDFPIKVNKQNLNKELK